MRRDLPARANLEHLKKQAKDLLDLHKRADPQSIARIRDALPAFAKLTDEAIAKAPFALHDAQSAVARECGTKSWSELREAVAKQSAANQPPSDALLRALLPLPFPPEVGALLRTASGRRAETIVATDTPLPRALPLVPIRDALFLPRALGPIQVARPSTRAAVEAALARTPPTLALFAQRAPEQERVDASALHPVGCEAFVHARLADGAGPAWVILEGLRWLVLESIDDDPRGYAVAHVAPYTIEAGDASEVEALAAPLRARTRDLASAFPDGDRLVALVDAASPSQLADLVVANLPVSVEEKAKFASETKLPERLRIATALVAARSGG